MRKWFRSIAFGVRRLWLRDAVDQDLDDEVRDFRERLMADHLRAGLSAEEAARWTRLEMGSSSAVKETARQGGWEAVVETTVRDGRLALRALRREPVFTLVVVLTLAIGLGAATTIFSAVNPILLEPLPYPHAERLVMVSDYGTHGEPVAVTYGTFLELVARSRSFDVLAVSDVWQPGFTGTGQAERLDGQRVSAGYFRALGVEPAAGRDFGPSEDRPDAPRVAIVSDGFARRHFGGASGILNHPINLNGDDWLVIGVLPPTFDNVLLASSEVWAPRRFRSPAPANGLGGEWGHHMTMVGRLKPGVSLVDARRELTAIAKRSVDEFPRPRWADLSGGLMINRLQDDVTRDVRSTLLAIFGAVTLLLAIACVNVTNLLLARFTRRRAEFAMRAALGAGRIRLVRHLLTESLVLSALGGLLGLVVARLGVRAIVALSPPGLPRLDAVRVDTPVFVFALAITALVGLVVGLAPALHAAGRGAVGIQHASARATGHRRLLGRALVVSEVAFALVLLVGAGLLERSLERLFSEAPGFEADHVLTMQVQVTGGRYGNDAALLQFFEHATDAVRAIPGVTAAAFTSQLPLSGDPPDAYGPQFASIPRGDPDWDDGPARYAVTPDYFKVMQIPLRRGRLLDRGDRPGATEAILLSESYAKRLFPGRDPIGERVRFGPETHQSGGPGAPQKWDVVVGLVGEVKQASLALGAPGAFYVSAGQWAWVDNVQSLIVRTRLDPDSLAPAVKQAIWSVDSNQPIVRVTTMSALVARSEAQRSFALVIFEMFALVALVLAAIGLYGVLSGSVAERTREIGVRAALGASREQILRMVLGEGLSLTGVGIVIGLGGAVLATPAVAALLFGVTSLDLPTHAAAVAVFLAVATMACAVPAWRAVRVDALSALREN